MRCLHCQQSFHADWTHKKLDSDSRGEWCIKYVRCPQCKDLAFSLEVIDASFEEQPVVSYPRGRTQLSSDVPDEFAKEYREACLVLGDSPKASAALSRRLLEKLLVEKAGVKAIQLAPFFAGRWPAN